MPKQSITCTALPNGLKSAASPATVKLSMFISPSLTFEGGQSEGELKDFEDFLNWPAVVSAGNLEISVVFQGGAQPVSRQAEIDLRVRPDPALWGKLFNKHTLVRARSNNFTGLGQPYSSYPASDITQKISTGYQKLGISSPYLPAGNDALKGAFPELQQAISSSSGDFSLRIRPFDDLAAATEAELINDHAELSRELLRADAEASLEDKLSAAVAIAGRRSQFRGGANAVPIIPPTNEPASAFAQFQAFHHRSPGAAAASNRASDRKDFHQIIAALAEYPEVLRRLGLVIDLEVTASQNEVSQFGNVRRVLVVPKFTRTAAPIHSYSPETKYLFDFGTQAGPLPFAKFCAAPRQSEDAASDAALALNLEIVGGLLNLRLPHPGHSDPLMLKYDLIQIDVDGAGLKLINAFGNMAREDLHPGKPIDGTDKTGAPVIRTSGITLTCAGQAESLITDLAHTVAHVAARAKDEVTQFHAEELVRGYRIDVRRFPLAIQSFTEGSGAAEWKSLHQRRGTYRFGGNEPGPITLSNIDDEGYVQPVLTQAATPGADGVDTIYVPESLCRWPGWSLSAPPPATPFDTGDTLAPMTPAAQNLPAVDVQFEPARGSLPYLRFGNYYQLRARTVDLAGNSLSVSEADAVIDALERNHREVPVLPAKPNEFQYRRFDPLAAPVVVLCSVLTEGETPDLLVIRSNRGQSTAQYAAGLGDPKYRAVNERHIVPAKSSQLSAEVHGKLDGAFGTAGNPDRFYNICLRERGSLEDAAIVNLTTGNSEPLPDVSVQTSSSGGVTVVPNGIGKLPAPGGEASYVIHYEKMLRLPYLPDPAVRGAALFGLPGVRGQTGEINASGALDFTGPQVLPPAARDALGDVTKINFGPANAWPELLPFKLQLDENPALGQERLPEWDRVKRILKVRVRPGETRTIWLSSYPAAEDIDGKLFGLHYWWSIRAGSAAEQREFLNTARHGALSMLSPAHKLTLVHAVQQPLRLAPAAAQGALGIVRFKTDTSIFFSGKFRIHAPSTAQFDLIASWRDPEEEDPQRRTTTHVLEVPVQARGHTGAMPENSFPIAIYDDDTLQFNAPPMTADAATRAKYPARHDFGDTKHRRVTYKLVATTRYKEFLPKRITDDEKNVTLALSLDESVPSSAAPSVPEVTAIHPVLGWKDLRIAGKLERRDRFGGGLRIYLGKNWYSSGEGEQVAVLAATAGIDPVHPPAATEALAPSVPPVAIEGRGTIYPFTVSHDKARGYFCDITFKVGSSYFPFIRLSLARYQANSLKGMELSEIIDVGFQQLAPNRAVALKYEDSASSRKIIITVEGAEPAAGNAIGHQTEVILEERNAADFATDPELGWSPAAQQPISETRPFPRTQLWVGNVTVPIADATKKRRLLIREFELFAPNTHPAGQGWLGQSAADQRNNRRLVYADTIPV
jgi:hypothetical protein